MATRKPPITLPSVDALFGIPNTGESVQEISIKQLHSFRDHPFRVEPDEKLIESVREYGVLSPLLARNKAEGEYEIISGHRRKAAAEQIGLDKLPVLVRDLTDEEAIILMVDSNMQVQAFLPIHLAEYMSSLVGKSKSIVTKNRATLIGLFSTAYDNGLINVEITRNFPKIVGTYTGHKALDRVDISLITTNYQLHEAGLGMMIMLWAGLRKGEAVALCWEDIDFERNVIHVTKSHDIVHNVTKGPKTQAGVRDVPMFAALRQALLSKRQESGLVFPKKTGGLHTSCSLNLAIRSFCSFIERVKNGVPHPERAQGFRMDVWQKRFAEQGREWEEFSFTAHDLRTTFATMCYDAGVDLHTAKRWMGHSSVETTLSIYTKLSNERRVESTDAMDAYSAALTG